MRPRPKNLRRKEAGGWADHVHAILACWVCWWFFGPGLVAPAATVSDRDLDPGTVGGRLPLPSATAYQIDAWETDQGLPENSATAIVQSPDGYLWFGTFNGLVRFDGVRFTVLNPVNTPQLPGPAVINLHLDRSGRLWVSTDRGLVTLANHRWSTYGTNEGWAGNYVRSFAERANGDLFMTTFDGHLLEFSQGRLHELPHPPRATYEGYFAHVDEQGHWWAIQNRFVGRWTPEGWVESIKLPALGADAVGCGTARDGSLILVALRTMERWSRGVRIASVTFPEAPGGVWSVSEDHAGNVWICTFDKGLCQVRPDGSFHRWTAADGLTHPNIRVAFEDAEGSLWVGTSGAGLLRLKPRRIQVFGTESGFTERTICSLASDGTNGLWVATFGKGLFHLHGGRATPVKFPGHTGNTMFAHSVLRDRAGRVWLGTLGLGIWQMDGHGVRRIPAGEHGCGTVLTVFEDSLGRVWFGGEKALALNEAGRIRKFTDETGSTVQGVLAMAEHPDGRLWFSNAERVHCWSANRFVEVRSPEGQPLRDVLCFLPNADGSIWMGTRNEGLLHWQAGRLGRVDGSVGLPSNAVHGMLEDDLGYYWMTSRQGVMRGRRSGFEALLRGDIPRVSCQLLDTADGMVGRDCPSGQQPVGMKDSNGRLWFATLKGVAMVDPRAFRLNARPPPVHIESLAYQPEHSAGVHDLASPSPESLHSSVGNEGAFRVLRPPFDSRISLPAGSHGLEIRYSAMSLSAPEKIRFEVKLEPQDATWRSVGGNRSIYYHDIQPGDYLFRVRAANNDGVWNEVGSSLAFAVRPYPWQTRWFYVGSTLLLVGLGAGAAVWRHRTLHRRNLESLDRDRRHHSELAHFGRVAALGQMASSIAHELNQPLGAILRNSEAGELLMRQQPLDVEELRAILSDIQADDRRASAVIGRMRALLKHGRVEGSEVDARSLCLDVVELVEFEARSLQARLVVDLPASLPKVFGDRVQLQQVVLNLLLNALDAVRSCRREHRVVTVAARVSGRDLVITVSDCGPGLAPDSLPRIFEAFHTTKPNGLGMGLTIARSIVEAHGGTLSAANRNEGGAVFRFTVPMMAHTGTP